MEFGLPHALSLGLDTYVCVHISFISPQFADCLDLIGNT